MGALSRKNYHFIFTDSFAVKICQHFKKMHHLNSNRTVLCQSVKTLKFGKKNDLSLFAKGYPWNKEKKKKMQGTEKSHGPFLWARAS